jgi:hypothetical protein
MQCTKALLIYPGIVLRSGMLQGGGHILYISIHAEGGGGGGRITDVRPIDDKVAAKALILSTRSIASSTFFLLY